MSEKTKNNASSDCSKLIHDITQNEINNNEKSFKGTNIYDKTNEVNNSGK